MTSTSEQFVDTRDTAAPTFDRQTAAPRDTYVRLIAEMTSLRRATAVNAVPVLKWRAMSELPRIRKLANRR